jgi:CheY-like chemotaxis protein
MQSKRILVVDDVEFSVKLIKEIFDTLQHDTGETFSVDTAKSVAEAKRALGNGAYDIVITDMNLGDGTGTEVANLAKASVPPAKKVIALTALPNAFEKEKESFTAFITKPNSPMALKEELASLL